MKCSSSSTSEGTRTMRSVCRRCNGDRNRRSWRGVDGACKARMKKTRNRTREGIRKTRSNTRKQKSEDARKEQEGSAEGASSREQCAKGKQERMRRGERERNARNASKKRGERDVATIRSGEEGQER